MKISCPKCGKSYDIPGTAVEQLLATRVHCDCGNNWLFPEESPVLRFPFELYLTFHGAVGSVLPADFFQAKFQCSKSCSEQLIGKLQKSGILSQKGRPVVLRSPLFYELMAVCETIQFEKEESEPAHKITRKQILLYAWILLQLLLILWLLCGAPLGWVGRYFCG